MVYKPIGISQDNWDVLNSMRQQKKGRKEFESFNDVISRLLGNDKKVPDAEE